jgi:predicted nicotinamide N-methyase
LRVLELGSGCGIVGIGLAQIIPNCDVLLTDLPEAQDILARNVECSSPAKSSRVSACILDWEEDLPKAILKRVHDAILVSDCTYNTDTIPALVSTLSKLSSISPQAVISLATKVRHSSEAEFFTLMEDAQFSIDALDSINLPTLAPDNDGDNETVEIYVFRRNRGVNEGNP